MRIWVRPDRLASLGLTVGDLTNAISSQNTLSPAGQIGGQPAEKGTQFTYTMRTQSRLLNAEEFGSIIVRSNEDGSQVLLKDVARIELGLLRYNSTGRLTGKPAAVVAVYQSPGSNALDVRKQVEATMKELATTFPQDLAWSMPLDTTEAISEGINEIVHTLFEAVLLVILVVFVFLQNWRATLIPLLTVPVSLIATFAVFPILGFSVNVLSLLGLVLAIGIVVDDAIVVVEAVMHHIEHGLSPRDATLKAMQEVSGPVVAIALILTAVFVPVAFMGGITGRLYQQFAVTIAISVCFSAFNALTLSPALAAMLLKPKGEQKSFLDPFYSWFNRVFGRFTDGYISFTSILIRKTVRSLIFIGIVIALTGGLVKSLPTGFLPDEDNGYFMINVQLPDAASLERTDAILKKVEKIVLANPAVEGMTTVSGISLLTGSAAPNTGFIFVKAKPWKERKDVKERADVVMRDLNLAFDRQVPEAEVLAFAPPPIPGLGSGSGFTFMLQDTIGRSPRELDEMTRKFLAAAQKRPEIGRISSVYRSTVPQLYANVDAEKALKMGVDVQDVNDALGALLGSSYINDFNRFGRVYKVYLQAEPEYRASQKVLGLFFVRSKDGQMVPLDTIVTMREMTGPDFTVRFNLFRSAEISGVPAAGLQLGPGAQRPRGDGEGGPAGGLELRLVEHVVPGKDGRRHRRHRLPLRDGLRLPDPGGAVRELVPAVQRPPRDAVRRLRRLRGPLDLPPPDAGRLRPELREQRLRPDRARHAHRPGGQERDPHRRVREDEARGGDGDRRGGARRGQAPLPADPDDGLRLHPRHAPAREGLGRGRRVAEGDGDGGLRGNADRHDAGRPPHPGPLRPRGEARSEEEGTAPRTRPRSLETAPANAPGGGH